MRKISGNSEVFIFIFLFCLATTLVGGLKFDKKNHSTVDPSTVSFAVNLTPTQPPKKDTLQLQTLTVTDSASIGITPTVIPVPPPAGQQIVTWLPDPEVTFTGKSAVRATNFLDWTLTNYQWANKNISLLQYWADTRNLVYAALLLSIVVTAFIMIATRGKSITLKDFIKKIFLIICIATFSFAITQLLYQITDIIEMFFIKTQTGTTISSHDLLNLSLDYKNFQGFRLSGTNNDEAAITAINLTKITSIAYYVLAGVLLIRKIILWFFIALSPLVALFILYAPLKNTLKVWLKEFFKWLLYAPILGIFLSGLIALWKNKIISFPFIFLQPIDPTKSLDLQKFPYPTAINILLGGPGQLLSLTNNLNYNGTYTEYIIALIMLWVAILLPFVLISILLDNF